MVDKALPVLFLALCCAGQQAVLDSDVPDYKPVAPMKGALSLGPDGGFESLLGLWTQRLKSYHPDLRVPVPERKPSLSTPKAMTSGAARWGLMGRRWSDLELEDFQVYWESPPIELIVAADAVAIVVHRDNPVRGLKLEELEAIYSSTRRRGSPAIRTWGDLGLGDAWKNRPVHAFGIKADSTPVPIARNVFVDRVLQKGSFRSDVKELSGLQTVLLAVSEDPLAIGFVTFSTQSNGVRQVPLLPSDGGKAVDPTRDNILNLSYPLAWQIRLSYYDSPRLPLEPSLRELVALILSRDGQSIAAEEGYVPISGPIARKQMKLLK